jgi:hypothetical protein
MTTPSYRVVAKYDVDANLVVSETEEILQIANAFQKATTQGLWSSWAEDGPWDGSMLKCGAPKSNFMTIMSVIQHGKNLKDINQLAGVRASVNGKDCFSSRTQEEKDEKCPNDADRAVIKEALGENLKKSIGEILALDLFEQEIDQMMIPVTYYELDPAAPITLQERNWKNSNLANVMFVGDGAGKGSIVNIDTGVCHDMAGTEQTVAAVGMELVCNPEETNKFNIAMSDIVHDFADRYGYKLRLQRELQCAGTGESSPHSDCVSDTKTPETMKFFTDAVASDIVNGIQQSTVKTLQRFRDEDLVALGRAALDAKLPAVVQGRYKLLLDSLTEFLAGRKETVRQILDQKNPSTPFPAPKEDKRVGTKSGAPTMEQLIVNNKLVKKIGSHRCNTKKLFESQMMAVSIPQNSPEKKLAPLPPGYCKEGGGALPPVAPGGNAAPSRLSPGGKPTATALKLKYKAMLVSTNGDKKAVASAMEAEMEMWKIAVGTRDMICRDVLDIPSLAEALGQTLDHLEEPHVAADDVNPSVGSSSSSDASAPSLVEAPAGGAATGNPSGSAVPPPPPLPPTAKSVLSGSGTGSSSAAVTEFKTTSKSIRSRFAASSDRSSGTAAVAHNTAREGISVHANVSKMHAHKSGVRTRMRGKSSSQHKHLDPK